MSFLCSPINSMDTGKCCLTHTSSKGELPVQQLDFTPSADLGKYCMTISCGPDVDHEQEKIKFSWTSSSEATGNIQLGHRINNLELFPDVQRLENERATQEHRNVFDFSSLMKKHGKHFSIIRGAPVELMRGPVSDTYCHSNTA